MFMTRAARRFVFSKNYRIGIIVIGVNLIVLSVPPQTEIIRLLKAAAMCIITGIRCYYPFARFYH